MTTTSMPTPPTSSLLMLRSPEIASLVSMEDAVDTQRRAFVSLAGGQAVLAPRLLVPGRGGSFGFVYSSRSSRDADLVVKAGSLVPDNAARGLDTISALVLVLDAVTGQPKAMLDGAAVTDLRTVAASAAVAQTLCPTPEKVAVIGFGLQGRSHAQVLSRLLRPAQLTVWSRSATADAVHSLGLPGATLSASASEAVADADLVVLCTTSRDPVIELEWLRPTATLLSLGSVAADRREVGPDIVRSARIVVDDAEAAARHAGPIVHALEAGIIGRDQLESIGNLMSRADQEPVRPAGLTYYNSVGIGIQDAAIVELILDRAAETDIGETWDW